MTLTVRGLVIRVQPYKDYDKLLSVLTEEHGKLFFKANAVRSVTSPNASACNPFSYSEFVLQKKQDRYYLTRAQLLDMPLGYACEVETLSAASYFGEVCDDVSRDQDGAKSALRLLSNALILLRKADRPVSLIKAIFELRLLSAIGFMPQLSSCGACGRESEKSYFHFADGTLLCASCAKGNECVPISSSCRLLAFRTVSVSEREAYAVQVNKALLEEFAAFSEHYLLAQLQRDFKTLAFYHNIKDL